MQPPGPAAPAPQPEPAQLGLAGAFARLSGASFVSMALQIGRGKLAALFLGPAGVGIFNQLSLMWNLFTLVGTLGMQNGIIHHAARHVGAEDGPGLRRLVSTVSITIFAMAFLAAVAGAVFSPQISNLLLDDRGEHAELVALMMLAVPIGASVAIYKSLLSAARAVPQLVRAQIISDVLGAGVFAALIIVFGLRGAVLGFVATHFFFLAWLLLGIRHRYRTQDIVPRARDFSVDVLKENTAFGINGLILIFASNLAILAVSRLIIEQLGLAANGIFSSAFRLSGVYLVAVTATAISYFLPTLSQTKSSGELSHQVNLALRFYLLVLPPLMALIACGAEFIIWLILSSEFAAAAPILILLLPGELARVLAETIGTSLLARRRIVSHTLLYFVFVGVFVVGSVLSLPSWGLIGVAISYTVAQFLTLAGVYAQARRSVGLALEARTIVSLCLGITVLVAAVAAALTLPFGPLRVAVTLVLMGLWTAALLQDPATRRTLADAFVRLRRRV